MAQLAAYLELLDWLERQAALDPSEFLHLLQTAYGTGPITYIDAAIINGRIRLHSLHHSHSRSHRQILGSRQGRPAEDQILRLLVALEPIQLTSWNRSGVRSPPIVGYPLPGRQCCLIVETASTPADIDNWRRLHDRDFLSLGAVFNARLSRSATIGRKEKLSRQPLTRRERETLAWIAAGKSYWETAVILGISERTIRHFMANARQKLDVVNNAQAVAEAVWRGLIPRFSDTQEM